ncbi:CHAT domain-containing protein [Maridesulfovibrio sp.]|uniref:CHAT domain-containing protein n=1 Tax=Maridesulfovibrio sp. TaxID=2795000 RepID=UPI002A18A54B|nr:CHAT domain-containing protein [Maridesulfovibrio sp.]
MKNYCLLYIMLLALLLCPTHAAAKKPDWVKGLKKGQSCLQQENYECAIKAYSKTLKQIPRRKSARPLFQCYSGLGNAYKSQARYGLAEENYLKALEIAEKMGENDPAGMICMRLAEISGKWGDRKSVKKHLKKAEHFLKDSNNTKNLTVLNTALAIFYLKEKEHAESEKYMLKALEFANESASFKLQSKTWNRLGKIYLKSKQLDKAEHAFLQGLKINEQLGNEEIVAENLTDITKINIERQNLDQAKSNADRALAINTRLGRKKNIADDLHLLGVIAYDKGDYNSAIDSLNKAVQIKNKLRETAQGSRKRTYLASQINSYNRLIDAYSARKDTSGFFDTFEMSRARQLAETIGDNDTETHFLLPEFQEIIPEQSAVLMFSVTGKNRLRLLAVDQNKSLVKRLRFKEFTEAVNQFQTVMTAQLNTQTTGERGFKSSNKKKVEKLPPIENIMEAVTRYRTFLSDPADIHKQDRILLAKELYSLLLEGAAQITSGKKRLIIIPDGPLALIPFETLQTTSNNYLVQDFEIGYVQSAAILKVLGERNSNRKDLSIIALGGAEYEKHNPSSTPKNVCEDEALDEKIVIAFKNRQPLNFAYSCLELDRFSDLPGTADEIEKISSIFKQSTLIKGSDVNEKYLRKLSDSGALNKAGIIHFAVHGIAVPTRPELSALVLSRTQGDDSNDGFLNAAEIRKLKIGADFVNLSACETGLGALVRGEGVVGLTHAFLTAGAGAMSVSLWNVSDRSAVDFMTDMYGKVEKGSAFEQALSATKKDFINGKFGKRMKKPYYWAPFVYYGR